MGGRERNHERHKRYYVLTGRALHESSCGHVLVAKRKQAGSGKHKSVHGCEGRTVLHGCSSVGSEQEHYERHECDNVQSGQSLHKRSDCDFLVSAYEVNVEASSPSILLGELYFALKLFRRIPVSFSRW